MLVKRWSKYPPGFRILLLEYSSIDEVDRAIKFFADVDWAFGADEENGMYVSIPHYTCGYTQSVYPLDEAAKRIVEECERE